MYSVFLVKLGVTHKPLKLNPRKILSFHLLEFSKHLGMWKKSLRRAQLNWISNRQGLRPSPV
jgi:hypothetical protein